MSEPPRIPFVNNVLSLAGLVLDFLEMSKGIQLIGDFFGFISDIGEIVASKREMVNNCEDEGEFSCDLDAKVGEAHDTAGALHLPMCCWSSYFTFFGDNEQLSCSAADTCKESRVALFSDTLVCAACPAQSNPSILKSACDQLTGFCTCGVPELRSDCLEPGSAATCLLINDELRTSRSAVACDDCQYDRMCLHWSQVRSQPCMMRFVT
jgi:hypothetical protein